MLLGISQKLNTVGVPTHIQLGNALLEQVDNFKYLGLNLDATLNWNCQVKAVSFKVAQCIGVMYGVTALQLVLLIHCVRH